MDSANPIASDRAAVQFEQAVVERWLECLDAALQSERPARLASLFAPDGHWRDLLAFTGSITPSHGAENIARSMAAQQRGARARGFAIAEGRTPPRRVQRAGNDVIEAIFTFE